MKAGAYRKIVGLDRKTPDKTHDTRRLECGHSVVVARATLHPLRSRCLECEGRPVERVDE